MAKFTLDRTYIYWGKFYGPGDAEVPDELAQSLGAGDAPAPLAVPSATPPARSPARGKKKAEPDADPK